MYLSKRIADIDYRNSKDTWKQIGTIFNIRKRKTERVETAKVEDFTNILNNRMRGLQTIVQRRRPLGNPKKMKQAH